MDNQGNKLQGKEPWTVSTIQRIFSYNYLVSSDQSLEFSINGFKLIRNDKVQTRSNIRPSHGLALYVRDNIKIPSWNSYNTKNVEYTLLNSLYIEKDVQIVMAYKAPNVPFNI